MTRRILLTLADDVTDRLCGSCSHVNEDGRCMAFDVYVLHGYERFSECIAAEAAAARMVEIAPEDAAAWSRSRGVMMPSQADYDTATRVEAAIVAHGKVQP